MKDLRAAIGICVLLTVACPAQARLTPEQIQALPPPASRPVVFSKDIKPIFDASCVKCHARGRAKGGFQLDSRDTVLKGGESGPAVMPGHSEESLLIELVSSTDPDNAMPKKGKRLTPEQVGLLRAWIDQRLHWDEGVSLARGTALNLLPRAKPIPEVSTDSDENPIDQILKPYFREHGFKPPGIVDDRQFERRAYLDVIGLLPPTDGPGAFVTDEDPQFRARLVRSLLADKERYAEHWLTFWNDLLRNDYRGAGYIDGGRKSITDWLFAALLSNMPYDKFVAQLIDPGPGSEGFTKGIVWRGTVNASQSPPLQAAQNISQVFMGVNLKCASCHDSFINDWRLSDAYNLATVYSSGPIELYQCDKPTGKTAQARFIYPELGTIDASANRPERLQELASIISSPKDGRLPRTIVNRLWARFFGRGLVEPLDDMEQPAWNSDLLDWLAEDLVANHYDLKHTIELMLTSHAYQLPAIDLKESEARDFAFRGPGIRRLSAEEFRDALGELTGVWFNSPAFNCNASEVRCGLVAADTLAVALGRPNREQVVTSRSSTANTLQAVELTNGATLANLLGRAAFRFEEDPRSNQQLVNLLFQRAFGRLPDSSENQLALGLLAQSERRAGVEDLLWAMTMQPEFQLIY
ncbi:MAG TPA: PSD1 and planctomycete cytochrome C domain-containing protein [Verrucomicrobiae bacterium]|nr:PSD1 and planctomycete cytochrome C domain-containing protein [Verrucomicrobiae bacterium]